MARGDALDAGIEARIAASAYLLTVRYPPARPAPTGSAPGAAPANPLTGTPPTTTVVPTTPTPAKADVTLPCLWLDLVTSVPSEVRRDGRDAGLVGWSQEVEALARVRVSDAAEDPTQPFGRTIFDDCLEVLAQGRVYRVLGVKPIAASFRLPRTYYVGLAGAIKQ